ncbi:hypothetical protein ADUPG1_012943, partial [Aduncisulcus paluster]
MLPDSGSISRDILALTGFSSKKRKEEEPQTQSSPSQRTYYDAEAVSSIRSKRRSSRQSSQLSHPHSCLFETESFEKKRETKPPFHQDHLQDFASTHPGSQSFRSMQPGPRAASPDFNRTRQLFSFTPTPSKEHFKEQLYSKSPSQEPQYTRSGVCELSTDPRVTPVISGSKGLKEGDISEHFARPKNNNPPRSGNSSYHLRHKHKTMKKKTKTASQSHGSQYTPFSRGHHDQQAHSHVESYESGDHASVPSHLPPSPSIRSHPCVSKQCGMDYSRVSASRDHIMTIDELHSHNNNAIKHKRQATSTVFGRETTSRTEREVRREKEMNSPRKSVVNASKVDKTHKQRKPREVEESESETKDISSSSSLSTYSTYSHRHSTNTKSSSRISTSRTSDSSHKNHSHKSHSHKNHSHKSLEDIYGMRTKKKMLHSLGDVRNNSSVDSLGGVRERNERKMPVEKTHQHTSSSSSLRIPADLSEKLTPIHDQHTCEQHTLEEDHPRTTALSKKKKSGEKEKEREKEKVEEKIEEEEEGEKEKEDNPTTTHQSSSSTMDAQSRCVTIVYPQSSSASPLHYESCDIPDIEPSRRLRVMLRDPPTDRGIHNNFASMSTPLPSFSQMMARATIDSSRRGNESKEKSSLIKKSAKVKVGKKRSTTVVKDLLASSDESGHVIGISSKENDCHFPDVVSSAHVSGALEEARDDDNIQLMRDEQYERGGTESYEAFWNDDCGDCGDIDEYGDDADFDRQYLNPDIHEDSAVVSREHKELQRKYGIDNHNNTQTSSGETTKSIDQSISNKPKQYDDLSSLQAENKQLSSSVSSSKAEIEALQVTLKSTQALLEDRDSGLSSLQAENKQLSSSVSSSKAEIEALQAENKQLSSSVSSSKAEIEALQAENKQLSSSVSSSKAEIETLQAENKQLSSSVSSSKAEIETLQAENKQLSSSVSSSKAEIEALQVTLKSTQALLEDRDSGLSSLQAENKQLSSSVSSSKAEIETLQATLKSTQALLEDRDSGLSSLQAENKQLSSSVSSSKAEIEALQVTLKSTQALLEDRDSGLSSLQAENKQLSSSVSSSKAEIETLQAENKQLSSSVSSSKAEIETLQAENKQLSSSVSSSKAEIETLQATLKSTQALLEDRYADLSSLQAENKQLSSSVSSSKAEIEALQVTLKSTQALLEDRDSGLSSLQAENKQLSSSVSSSKAEIEALQVTLKSTQALLEDRDSGLSSLQAENKQLSSSVSSSKAEIETLQATLKSTQALLEDRDSGLSSLQAENKQLSSSVSSS